ncbi:fasciclin-like arabinogalactan protein 3 [Panicum miliaceum]|uniref:Fasciclin-like arabinogalactan protein 3 n=1 Tax=Panicum miliaceum TaxID=4540 RepID=A0A3L6RSL2_PANMI|nr:fasciclin-like arabinogalactan protein 3 [Panicum miliaceum]
MASKILLSLLVLAAASPAALAAFDVIQMLVDKPQYAGFSKVLEQTKVAGEANQLKAASLLVVPEKTVKSLVALPADKLRQAVANHVLLSYFDPIKLDEMKTRTALLPTLLSNTDKALGVLNYSKADDGQMYFGAPGAPCVAKLVKVVAARPYTISIMEISEPILPPGSGKPDAAPGRRGKGGKGGKGKIKPAGLDESSEVTGKTDDATGKAESPESAAAAPSPAS